MSSPSGASGPRALAPSTGALAEVLRRCHRAELLPLAQVLEVQHDGLGLASLTTALDLELRRRGANRLGLAILGDAMVPRYRLVLGHAARRLGLAARGDDEALELAVALEWVRRSWPLLDGDARAAARRTLGLEGDGELVADVALVSKRSSRGLAFPYYVALAAVSVVALPAAPLAGCAALFWAAGPRDAALLPALLQVVALRQATRYRVTLGLVGSPSSGKDAALRALFGMDSGNINPIAGSTREVTITQLPIAAPTYAVNTPGLGDVIQAVTDEARQVLDLIDVFVYVVNAQGGVQQRERDDFRDVVARDRPVVVALNKVDTLKPEDVERMVADTRTKLGGQVTVLPVAFDPLPQLAEAPIGIDALRAWVLEALRGLGKERGDELFATDLAQDVG